MTLPFATLPTLAFLSCIAAVAGLLWAEARESMLGKCVFKLTASTAFIVLALASGALASPYGQWVLLALVLSWAGDAFLLSSKPTMFLLGLGAFLLAHIAFAAAFIGLGFEGRAFALSLAGMALVGGITLRWLWRHLSSALFRGAVVAYVAAIVVMCATALAASAASGAWVFGAAALVFAASDIAVARQNFVQPSLLNKLWGLPLYYAAQLALAWSVALFAK